MALFNISGHIQTGVIGLLLILSVFVPNMAEWSGQVRRRRLAQACRRKYLGSFCSSRIHKISRKATNFFSKESVSMR